VRTRLLVVLGSVALVAAAGTASTRDAAYAQTGESIPTYRVTLTVGSDGGLHVQEVIGYDFGDTEHHGIIREIPDRRPYGTNGKKDQVYPISHVHVTASPGTPTKTKQTDDNGVLQIRIGDPNRTITGLHTYTIDYDVAGALSAFADHVELDWNAIGTEWTVPIDAAQVRISAPARITKVACSRGSFGSDLPCKRARAVGRTATFTDSNLFAGEGVTVVAALPPGSVTATGPILKDHPSVRTAFAAKPLSLTLTGLLLAGVAASLIYLWWARGRDRRYAGQIPTLTPVAGETGKETPQPLFGRGPVAVEFAPPDDIRPGQVGTLQDERANTLDVTATIVDLAVRKYLTIKELDHEHWFSHKDWELTKLPDADEDKLLQYERRLLDGLFEKGNPVKLSELKNTFGSDLAAVEKAMYADAVKQGWFARNPETVRAAWHGAGVATIIGGIIATVFLASHELGLVGLAIIVTGIAILVVRNAMPARTGKGSAMLARVRGFRTYIATAEAEQLKFEEREQMFARYLPFAIVFGLTEHWAKVFDALAAGNPNLAGSVGWYSGPSGWSYGYFAASMASFTTSANGVIASHPVSSGGTSGFSGGGFSGGGGGGGGGGSW
jgi:uncharacterized membrane protein YgcG